MSVLTIVKGQEFKVVVKETITEDDMFINEYKSAATMLDEIISASNKVNKNRVGRSISGWKENEFENNIIAFCGERGEGKSSVMLSFVNAVSTNRSEKTDKNENVIFSSCHNIKHSYFTEPIVIDPSLFDDIHNVLDIVLAKIFRNFDKQYRRENKDIDEYMRERLLDQFQKVYRYVSLINNQTKMLDDEFDYEGNISKLSKLGESTNLKVELRKLIVYYLDFMAKFEMEETDGNGQLILAIDDLDLCSSNAYKLAEQIRKYLIIPNVIIVMAVKIEQLELCVEEKNLEDYKRILSLNKGENYRERIKEEVLNMAERYVAKLIPKARRIYLPKAQSLNEIQIIYKNSNDRDPVWSSRESQNLILSVLDLVYEKTGMRFLPEKGGFSYLLSDNLRDMINWIVLLADMPDGSDVVYLKNIQKFEKHFNAEWVNKQLSLDTGKEMQTIKNMDTFHIHTNTKWQLSKMYQECEKKVEFQPVMFRGERPDSFFDVTGWFEAYAKNLYSFKEEQYAYGWRVLYTIKIHQLLRENKVEDFTDFINGYIWGGRFASVLPAIARNQMDRSRFIVKTKDAFNEILDHSYLKLDKISEPESGRGIRVSYIPENGNREKYMKSWLLLGMLSNLYYMDTTTRQMIYCSTWKIIYDNSNLYDTIQISLENYLISLSNLYMIYDKVNMGMLGISREEFERVVKKIEISNADSIQCARDIIANMDIVVTVRDYCMKYNDYKKETKSDIDRSVKLVETFFENIKEYMKKIGMKYKNEEFRYFSFGKDEEGNTDVIDIYNLYAHLIDLCIRNSEINLVSDTAGTENEMLQELRKKLTDKSVIYNDYFCHVSSYLIKATPANAKENLDNLASNVERFIGKYDREPDSLDVEFLCDLYKRIIDLYLHKKEEKLSEELRWLYKKAVKLQDEIKIYE